MKNNPFSSNPALLQKINVFACLVEADQIHRLVCVGLDCPTNRHNAKTSVKLGDKYARVDVGTSGKYMVDLEGNIWGIKAYGVVHRGHQYGTVDTIKDWYWGGYAARPFEDGHCRVGNFNLAQMRNGQCVLTSEHLQFTASKETTAEKLERVTAERTAEGRADVSPSEPEPTDVEALVRQRNDLASALRNLIEDARFVEKSSKKTLSAGGISAALKALAGAGFPVDTQIAGY